MNFKEIKKYWDDRASTDSTAQSTTQDVYLREIECNVLSERINKYKPRSVADMGCGDGRTTIKLSQKYLSSLFSGYDYSSHMISNANDLISTMSIHNLKFEQQDVCEKLTQYFDLIYTTRCLINLPSWDLQKDAIENIHKALNKNGLYLMIENFIDGHENFNQVRKDFGLPEIGMRDHNNFFNRKELLDFISGYFSVVEEVNNSSTYYLVSRVIYSKICSEKNLNIDYFNDHHRYAAGLPFSGEFGPVRLICLKKL